MLLEGLALVPGLILQETAVQPGVSWDPEAVRKGVSGSGGRKAMLAHTEEGLGMHVCGTLRALCWTMRMVYPELEHFCSLPALSTGLYRYIYLKKGFVERHIFESGISKNRIRLGDQDYQILIPDML